MTDYSNYKHGLDIVEALTKRLDRLTGFDEELDTILGGHGPDETCSEDLAIENSNGSENVFPENLSDSSIIYSGVVEWCQHSSIVPQANGFGATANDYQVIELSNQELFESVNSTKFTSVFDTRYQSSNGENTLPWVQSDFNENLFNTGMLASGVESFSSSGNSHQGVNTSSYISDTKRKIRDETQKKMISLHTHEEFSLESNTPDNSVLRRFLDIPEYEVTEESIHVDGLMQTSHRGDFVLSDYSNAPIQTSGISNGPSQAVHLNSEPLKSDFREEHKLQISAHDELSGFVKEFLKPSNYRMYTPELPSFNNEPLQTSDFSNEISKSSVFSSQSVSTAHKNMSQNGDIDAEYITPQKTDQTLYDNFKEVTSILQNALSEYGVIFEDNNCKLMKESWTENTNETVEISSEVVEHCSTMITKSEMTKHGDQESFIFDTEKGLEHDAATLVEASTVREAQSQSSSELTNEIYSSQKESLNLHSASNESFTVVENQRDIQMPILSENKNTENDEDKVPAEDTMTTDKGIHEIQLRRLDLASVTDQEEFFTASECSGTTTPLSFQSAADRDIMSPRPIHQHHAAHILDKARLPMVPLVKDLSNFKSNSHMLNEYHQRFDSLNSENTSSTLDGDLVLSFAQRPESKRDTSSPYKYYEEFPTLVKDTTMEEFQQKHTMKLSPLQGCTKTVEELRRDIPSKTMIPITEDAEEELREHKVMITQDSKVRDMVLSERDVTVFQTDRLKEIIGANENQTEGTHSFRTIEEVRDVQHIKLSPLEGCSMDSQVISQEFSPGDYLSLCASRQAALPSHEFEQNTVLSNHEAVNTKSVTSSEHDTVLQMYTDRTKEMLPNEFHIESSEALEKYKEWNRNEMSMYQDEPQDTHSFRTIEEVRDIQHIKLSPLEGCSMDSQVISQEFSPGDYLSLCASRQAALPSHEFDQNTVLSNHEAVNTKSVTSQSEQKLPFSNHNAMNTKLVTSEQSENIVCRNESMLRMYESLEDSTRNVTRSPYLDLVRLDDTRNVEERFRGWNRDEMAMYHDEPQGSHSFRTIEEVRDIQHIKLSPLEGCSMDSQVISQEFSPGDYFMLKMGELSAGNEIDRPF